MGGRSFRIDDGGEVVICDLLIVIAVAAVAVAVDFGLGQAMVTGIDFR
jgi:uncharacterized YccA/Bax inhibitor family protein